MKSLILAPAKVVLRTAPQDWLAATGGEAVLLTGVEAAPALRESYGGVFAAVETFPAYTANDSVLVRADALATEHRFAAVLALSEVDVMRAALVRERHGIPGLLPADAVVFRDKLAMKQAALRAGVPVAEHRRVTNALEVEDFARAQGFPLVIKPIAGRGSAQTHIVGSQRELSALYESGLFSGSERVPDLLAEKFVAGDQYRVDGLYTGGRPVFLSVARYWGNHLDFLGGGALGSVILDSSSPVAVDAARFARRVLETALPFGPHGVFHLEMFRTPEGNWVLGEVGHRLGGGSINEEIETAFGFNLKLNFVETALGREPRGPDGWRRLAGQLHIASKGGKLEAIAENCPFDWVVQYRHAVAGAVYAPMSHTNAEVASFVVAGNTETEIEERLAELVVWHGATTSWAVGGRDV